ncbi:DNA alkylation repair protein [Sedimentibacter sp. zth1]|uniref:DNA alkylation repair protein n=1 Tax=Sedimentibacter sp. zth1 TaxID=2816908 RepID=UPI001A9151AC|nr:DNA alkylation repair protein [Sedimentibacter sp. zth1]QSX06099.1 DNA alkylation repair protein [Sedimentibacter sp. zth1]
MSDNTSDVVLCVRKELEELAEIDYKNFSSSLIPNVDNLMGVRIPNIRLVAKKLKKSSKDVEEYLNYFDNKEEKYFEEIMLQGILIGMLDEDINVVIKRIRKFVPKINNWSVCDTFCCGLKIVKKHRTFVWEFIKPYLQSKHAYDIRFAVVIMINHYMVDKYIDNILIILDSVNHDDYYVKMSVAWAISICFVNDSSKTMKLLHRNHLDDFTYNKALQKIRESLRVDKEIKEIIKSMKR